MLVSPSIVYLMREQGIREELQKFGPSDVPDHLHLERQNLEIWEVLQPEEERLESGGDLFPNLKNGRWITVEQEDAGEEDENVLYRAFVNAEIGSKRFRRRTRGAPYLLLLSTKNGESEPKITFCNQSGTLCLQRDCKLPRGGSEMPGNTLSLIPC